MPSVFASRARPRRHDLRGAGVAILLSSSAACSTLSLDDLQAGAGSGATSGAGAASSSTSGSATASSGAGGSGAGGAGGGGGAGGAGGAGVECPPRQGDCDGDGVCTSLEADAANCGACGHDCLGGDCVEGRCQPVTIYQGEVEDGRVRGIAIDAEHVFACAEEGVVRIPKAGGAVLPLHEGGVCTRIAIGGPHAYYTYGGLARVPLSGGDVEWLSGEPDVNSRGVAVDDTFAWAVLERYVEPFELLLVRAARDGSGRQSLVLGPEVWGVAVDGSSAYVGGEDGIFRVDPETFTLDDEAITSEDGGSDMVVIGRRLYFLGAGLWSVDLDTREETLLRPELSSGSLATDGEALYVTLFEVGPLYRVSLDGLTREELADLGPGIDVPAVDDEAVYVSQFLDQRVVRVAK